MQRVRYVEPKSRGRLIRLTAAPALMALALIAAAPEGHRVLMSAAHAVEPGEMLKDPELEARARNISAGLRCPVCQNQSIDDSNAPLSKDLRLLVRERLTAGDSDRAVVDYIVARYGEFVLLKPPIGWHTALLWLAPLALLLLALGYIAWRLRSGMAAAPADDAASIDVRAANLSLTPEEEERLARLLARDGGRAE